MQAMPGFFALKRISNQIALMVPLLAEWQSGYAAACKAVDLGSIPGSASNNIPLGACPRIGTTVRKSWIWPDSSIIFVKYAQYSPQIMKKPDSNQLPLTMIPILGQSPSLIIHAGS